MYGAAAEGRVLLLQSDSTPDEQKREQMERLVREELERWDSESSIQGSGRAQSPTGTQRRGQSSRSVSGQPPSRVSNKQSDTHFSIKLHFFHCKYICFKQRIYISKCICYANHPLKSVFSERLR